MMVDHLSLSLSDRPSSYIIGVTPTLYENVDIKTDKKTLKYPSRPAADSRGRVDEEGEGTLEMDRVHERGTERE